ncbi:hypothetical protein [Ancylobacter sp. FA202]|uniref:hypothetical protein n=1 Tax=Ancylobacter sp. FA202 TaxID=1111106 RepID=UPI00037206EB|nr:hypothetical protein [Ancylobacter sp. FA202]
MGSIFRDSNAPYVLAIIAGALGWLLNSAVVELKNTRFIEYTISYSGGADDRQAIVRFINRSMSQPISVGRFGFQCLLPPGETGPCFRSRRGSGQAVEFVRSGAIWLRSTPQLVTDDIYTVDAVVPPRAQVAYRMGLVGINADVRVGYDLAGVDIAANGGSAVGVVFGRGPTLEGWVLENYLSMIIYSLIFVGLCFVAWIVIAFVSLQRGEAAAAPR